jgi:hypothetical protein
VEEKAFVTSRGAVTAGRKKAVARVGLGPVGRGWDRRRLYFVFHDDELPVSPRLLRDERKEGGRRGSTGILMGQ